MESIKEDIKFGFATLLGSPTYALIAILTLALGIGSSTAMFTLVSNVLLKPLPFPNSEELVFFSTVNSKTNQENTGVSIEFFNSMMDIESPLQETTFYAFDQVTLGIGDQQKPFSVLVTRHNYLSMFGVRPSLGRWYDEQDVNGQTVVISDDVWRTEFASDPNMVGRVIQVNKQEVEVIGVMPPNYSTTGFTADFWRPITELDRPVTLTARLQPGLDPDMAAQQSAGIQSLVNQVSGDVEVVWRIKFTSMLDRIVDDSRYGLYLLLASVGAVFLIAVLNVVNLTFAQYGNRTQELAVRVAVGATKRRLLRQLLTESLLLCGIGGLLGLLFAAWTLEGIRELMGSRLPRLHEVGIDQTALVVMFILISVSALVTTSLPANAIVNPHKLAETIKQSGGKMTADKNSQKIRRGLVAGEVCVAVLLLIGAGLLLRSYQVLASEATGFDAENVVTGHVWLPDNFKPQPSTSGHWLNMLAALKSEPNVLAAAATSTMPMGRTGIDFPVTYSYPGAAAVPRGEEPTAANRSVTPGYFSLLNIPMLAGRDFDFRDVKESPRVVIVNKKLADAAWPNQNAVGKTLSLPSWMGGDHRVVGVVGNVKHRGLRSAPQVEFFLPVSQYAYAGMTFLVKTNANELGRMKNQMLKLSIEFEATAPMILLENLTDLTNDSIAPERVLLVVLSVFAAIAIVLASVGVFGISDNMVKMRTHEIGIRMAIGARPNVIKRWIVLDNSRTVLIGAGLGVLLAIISAQIIASRLYGVSAYDPLVYVLVPLILISVGVLATWVPASRATRVHPQQALHYE